MIGSRAAFLTFAGVVAALLGGEVFFTQRETAADEAVRKLNGIPPEENWVVEGRLQDPPATRFCYLGHRSDPNAYFETDSELGYRFHPNLRARPGKLRVGGREIFNATTSTGRFGWREVPQDPRGRGDVLFFGDSFVYGSGLSDEETLPARFSLAMKGAAVAHNFGVPGWGAQQTLRLLELGREKPELVLGRPTKAFFLMTHEQLPRLAGERPESLGSPRYELQGGKVVYSGRIPEEGTVAHLCGISAFCNWAREHLRPVKADFAPTEELAAVLARVQELLAQRYAIRLTVISWNWNDPALDAVERALAARGIDVISVKNALPGSSVEEWLIPFSRHPNARAAATLAQYLADRLRG